MLVFFFAPLWERPSVPAPVSAASREDFRTELRLAGILNELRREHALPELQLNSRASRGARRHSMAIARFEGYLFDRPGEKSLWDRLQEEHVVMAGSRALIAGPTGAGEPIGALRSRWLGSPDSLEVILDPSAEEFGIGVARSDTTIWLTVVIFSRPAGARFKGGDLVLLERQLVAGINEARRDRGLPGLRENPELVRVCRGLAERAVAAEGTWPRDKNLAPKQIKGVGKGVLRFRNHWSAEDPVATTLAAWQARTAGWAELWQPPFEEIGIGAAVDEAGRLFIAGFLMVRTSGARMGQQDLRAAEFRLTAVINDVRHGYGLAPLATDPGMVRAARAHSEDMARRGFYDHLTPEGIPPRGRLEARGIACRLVAENIGKSPTYSDPVKEAVQGWMNSPGHRQNILRRNVEITGVGLAVDEDGYILYTQMFCGL